MASQRASLKIVLVAIVSVLVGMMIPNKWRITVEEKSTRVPAGNRLIESVEGSALFEAYCAACHGKDGRGDGPATSSLKATIPDLTGISRRNGGKFPRELVQKIVSGEEPGISAHGSSEMPTWGPVFKQIAWDQDLDRLCIHNLTKYLESLQQN